MESPFRIIQLNYSQEVLVKSDEAARIAELNWAWAEDDNQASSVADLFNKNYTSSNVLQMESDGDGNPELYTQVW